MKKRYSKLLFVALISTTSILLFVGLLNLSGCGSGTESPCATVTFSIDDTKFDTQDLTLNIDGPDEFLPCLNGAEYHLGGYDGQYKWTAPAGQLSGAKWVVSGDIQITGDPNWSSVSIIGTKADAKGTLEFVTSNRDDCPQGNETLASKDIDFSFAGVIIIKSEVCIDPATKTGSGKLYLIDKSSGFAVTGITSSLWSATSGSATFKTDPADNTICSVSNATTDAMGNFVVSVQVSVSNACKLDGTLSFPITMSSCNMP